MSITTQVFWNPGPLIAAGNRSFVVSVKAMEGVAKANVRGSSGVRAGVTTRIVSTGVAILTSKDFKAKWWEEGTKAHTIAPRNLGRGAGTGLRTRRRKGTAGKGSALKFPDGGFSRAPVPHPGMSPRPFLQPSLPAWPVIYSKTARGVFAASGFGALG